MSPWIPVDERRANEMAVADVLKNPLLKYDEAAVGVTIFSTKFATPCSVVLSPRFHHSVMLADDFW